MEYAELSFPPNLENRGTLERRIGGVQVAVASSTLGRKSTAGRSKRGNLIGCSLLTRFVGGSLLNCQ